MTKKSIPPDLKKRIDAVKKKRPKTVLEHIVKYGHITTEELKDRYGYDHPPRAARDVREEGIPLETFRVPNKDGKKIGAYRLGDESKIRDDQLSGRKVFSKEFKEALIGAQGSKCAVCSTQYEDRYLQVDHKVPYEVSGDSASSERELDDYMLLCGSCNRAKSWSCEHCENWQTSHEPGICKGCYWASPCEYHHVATKEIRRWDIVWVDEEVGVYETLKTRSKVVGADMPAFVKYLLQKAAIEFK
jgi:5-methylcytosine-specific restriction endonuclease McrA